MLNHANYQIMLKSAFQCKHSAVIIRKRELSTISSKNEKTCSESSFLHFICDKNDESQFKRRKKVNSDVFI